MIGMMYLVLTCLLAMNVSKDILKGFITVNESLERSNRNYSENEKKLIEGMRAAITNGHQEVKPYLQQTEAALALCSGMNSYIEELKAKVQIYTEGNPHADTTHLRFIEKLDDYDKPTWLLIGEDANAPRNEAYSAKELRTKLTQLANSLLAKIDSMQKTPGLHMPVNDYQSLRDKLNRFIPQDPAEKENDVAVCWEVQNFNQLPLAAVITNLSKIQTDVHHLESEMISTFSSAAGKLAIVFDSLMPKVISTSEYVQIGQQYQGEVFLAASSSHFAEDNLQIVLGDFNRNTGEPTAGSVTLPIENGKAQVNFSAQSEGIKTYKGVIKFKEGTGNYKYFPFEKEYIVAQQAVAVSADKMNVFYAGVPNPITVSAAGIAPQDLVVELKNCSGNIVKTAQGKYEVYLNSTGKGAIAVSARTKDGLRPQGKPVEFRIKELPVPLAKAGGKSGYGKIDIPLTSAQLLSGLSTESQGFEFDARFIVRKFNLIIAYAGQSKFDEEVRGNQIPARVKQILSTCKRGTLLYFSDILAEGPDKKLRKLADLTLKVN